VCRRSRIVAGLLGVALCAQLACACNIPVFRYALERWQEDRYEFVVFGDADAAIGDADGTPANWNVVHYDPAPHDERDMVEIARLAADAGPYGVLRSPKLQGVRRVLWQGRLSDFDRAAAINSPARSELSERLLAGHSAVWLVVGDPADQRVQATQELLETALERLENSLPLPDGIDLPGSEVYSEVPLTLWFSALVVDPNAAEERQFVDQIYGNSGLDETGPVVVPVFGRGRALEVIPIERVDVALVEQISAFLSGACSCQVKEQNPGFDLLLAVDWHQELFPFLDPSKLEPAAPSQEQENAALTSLLVTDSDGGEVETASEPPPAELSVVEPEPPKLSASRQSPEVDVAASSRWGNLQLTLAGIGMIVLLGSWWLRR